VSRESIQLLPLGLPHGEIFSGGRIDMFGPVSG